MAMDEMFITFAAGSGDGDGDTTTGGLGLGLTAGEGDTGKGLGSGEGAVICGAPQNKTKQAHTASASACQLLRRSVQNLRGTMPPTH